jgi:branched-subunit amino acid aminotransferase/4-amino-4-deoxychorismate lyase
MIVNLNGEFVTPENARIPVDDGAFLFGDTLFETLKARGRTICFLEEHLDRIELAAGLLTFPFSREQTREALLATADRLESAVSRLRLTLSRGSFAGAIPPPSQAGHFVVGAAPYSEPTAEERSAGACCLFAPNRRVNPLSHLPQMKRGSYADCLYAADYARRRGAREALFVTEDGRVLEGATTNLFLLRDNLLVTPPAGEQVLAGIMRRQILIAAERLGLAVEERDVPVAELFEAGEIFITNALIDLLPVASVEGRSVLRGAGSARLLETVHSLERG